MNGEERKGPMHLGIDTESENRDVKNVPEIMQDSDASILTFEEATRFLKIKKSTMYKIMKQPGAPKFVRIGARRIITRKSLLEWVEKNEGKEVRTDVE